MDPYYVMMLFGLGMTVYAVVAAVSDKRVRQPRMRELERQLEEDYEKILREAK
ncbi:MAG: hypothetical protein LBR80_00695 [Deltaproteobacteria bacterium]|jgi:hypothetical protein|nr:hypothetical protein [Deltaproteobacteria bacterium]